jgi:DNA topoisomerase-2
MTTKKEPVISSCRASDNWTSVTFKPDLAKFGMTELEPDTVALMRKRVYDLAGIMGKTCKVSSSSSSSSAAPGVHLSNQA